jgi:ABC-type proline/glycine betaine transport system permease subunit
LLGAFIEIERLSKAFDTAQRGRHLALSDISMTVEEGQFVSIVGPSGCGKSSLLYIVGGFVTPTSGLVRVVGKPVRGPGPDRGPVFQEFALFPWKTVLGNVSYGLLQRGVAKQEAMERARALIELVHLKGVTGRSRLVAAFCNPLMMVIYPVPKAALMPIIMLWLGVGEAAKILVIFLGVSLPVIYHSYQGARAVEEKMLWSAAAMGMGAHARLTRIVLPAALPEILVGVRTGLVLALITMVTSEMIARQSGVGNILFNALDMAQYRSVYAIIVVIGLIGFVLDAAFEKLRGVLVTWAEPAFPIVAGST